MPIIMNQLDQDMEKMAQTAVKTYSPKFFDKKLTGKGGSSPGVLSSKNNPPAVPVNKPTLSSYFQHEKPSTYHSGNTTTYRIPINPLHPHVLQAQHQILVEDKNDFIKIGTWNYGDVYVKLLVHSFTIEETLDQGYYTGVIKRTSAFTPAYTLRILTDYNHDSSKTFIKADNIRQLCDTCNRYKDIQTVNPIKDWNDDIQKSLVNYNMTIDTKAFMDYMLNYELFDDACAVSETWQEHMDDVMEQLIADLQANHYGTSQMKDIICKQVRYMMNYNIPLDKYRTIYNHIDKNFAPADASEICKQNLNLLLSNTLHNLDQNKSVLQTFKPTQPASNIPASVKRLSKEQLAAVKSTEPLILVQAGAGTGKSTLILGRIDYLISCGINPEDITVLSFTNAAADNITAKNPNVHSMTIARMIHEIYTTNFTTHELSQLETLLNSLEIYYSQDMAKAGSTVSDFAYYIRNMLKNSPTNFTDMNNFIENNYDTVIDILNTIRQTSLELEIIICYQKIDTFIEPASIRSKFLIIDEVQDNSIFEFVYTLKYVDKHKESMFIVGDCSQTLYEFRASNPRALNILEGSGTFATYQLNTNYRSNQEILDMANVLLNNIEANQYANIQLRANSRAQVTEQSFLEKVHFDYVQLAKMTDFQDALPSIFAKDVRPYLNQCLAKGEQVAILAFGRREIRKIQEILQLQYPNLTPQTDIVSLVPDRMKNDTLFSKFICKYWDQIQFAPTTTITSAIYQKIMSVLPYMNYKQDPATLQRVRDNIQKWITNESPKIQAWQAQLSQNQLTQDEFLQLVKENMLDYEIKTNAVKQSLLSSRNQASKQSANIDTAKILLSTIHSAKGLEFDHVVVIYKNDNVQEEDKKRMYYVAMTRAMKSEFILAYDTMTSPQIQADYMTVLKALHATNPSPNSPLNLQSKNKRIKI